MLNWQVIYSIKKCYRLWGLLLLGVIQACSQLPVFNYHRSDYELRRDVLVMKDEWFLTKCIGTTKLQCEDLFQQGTQRCLRKTGSPRVKCLYLELYCTLYGGKACWY